MGSKAIRFRFHTTNHKQFWLGYLKWLQSSFGECYMMQIYNT
jgi:hypothetical protein